jgi:hypothetical protein
LTYVLITLRWLIDLCQEKPSHIGAAGIWDAYTKRVTAQVSKVKCAASGILYLLSNNISLSLYLVKISLLFTNKSTSPPHAGS